MRIVSVVQSGGKAKSRRTDHQTLSPVASSELELERLRRALAAQAEANRPVLGQLERETPCGRPPSRRGRGSRSRSASAGRPCSPASGESVSATPSEGAAIQPAVPSKVERRSRLRRARRPSASAGAALPRGHSRRAPRRDALSLLDPAERDALDVLPLQGEEEEEHRAARSGPSRPSSARCPATCSPDEVRERHRQRVARLVGQDDERPHEVVPRRRGR